MCLVLSGRAYEFQKFLKGRFPVELVEYCDLVHPFLLDEIKETTENCVLRLATLKIRHVIDLSEVEARTFLLIE